MSKNYQLVADSINALPDQISQVLGESSKIKLPKNFQNINKIVLAGMGGSNLAGRLIADVFAKNLKVPLLINSDYEAPKYLDRYTLYILCSYSGNTEETLSGYAEARKRGAKILAITNKTADNKLRRLISRDHLTSYVFEEKHNPSHQPRLGVGYPLTALLIVLQKLNLLSISLTELKKILPQLKTAGHKLANKKFNNPARQLAQNIKDKTVILIGADFLAGNLHILRNQLNETGKNFASYLVAPELNHYALEGLAKPDSLKKNTVFICFDSNFYHENNQTRLQLTKKIIKKQNIPVFSYKLKGDSKLDQSLELLQLGSWISYYLAFINKIDPLTVPWVDWFKKELK